MTAYCYTVESLIEIFVDRELDLATTAEMRRHLRICRNCGNALTRELRFRACIRAALTPSPTAPIRLRRRILRQLDSLSQTNEELWQDPPKTP